MERNRISPLFVIRKALAILTVLVMGTLQPIGSSSGWITSDGLKSMLIAWPIFLLVGLLISIPLAKYSRIIVRIATAAFIACVALWLALSTGAAVLLPMQATAYIALVGFGAGYPSQKQPK